MPNPEPEKPKRKQTRTSPSFSNRFPKVLIPTKPSRRCFEHKAKSSCGSSSRRAALPSRARRRISTPDAKRLPPRKRSSAGIKSLSTKQKRNLSIRQKTISTTAQNPLKRRNQFRSEEHTSELQSQFHLV